jgi:cysteine sulfinate desulfinase/cysteine desulfurase-like protein
MLKSRSACERDEVLFTSGATESNNLALLGLRAHGEREGRKHLVATVIEHKAVLEPLEYLARNGFELTLVPTGPDGIIEPELVRKAVRPDTLLVSVMHVNNETGVVQPIQEIASLLEKQDAFFHVDAAQGYQRRAVTFVTGIARSFTHQRSFWHHQVRSSQSIMVRLGVMASRTPLKFWRMWH